MKKYLGIGSLVFILLAMTVGAFATPIPGSINELVNGNFETGNTAPWEVGSGLAFGVDGPAHNYGIYCKDPQESLLLRQVVDETLNPLWDWSLNQKQIDLVADIRCVWAEGDAGHPLSTISFRLDWWGPEWNGSPSDVTGANGSVPPTGPAEGYSDWVTFDFSQNASGVWSTVNPFVQDTEVLQWNGKPFQPRWVSVEVLINQNPEEIVWVDNLNLTAKCIPEPMSLVLGFMGLGSVVGLRRFVKK